MAESSRLVDLVQSRIDDFLHLREPIVTTISPELAPFVDFSRQFLRGGKRFRALFCYWGWHSVRADDLLNADENGDRRFLDPVVSAAAALELFHAAALVHDDIIDNSDTRRGAASAHKLFEGLHRQSGWEQGAADFGRDAAILLGDLMLGWSDELLDEGLVALGDANLALATRAVFNRMRTEVTAGQYLDILGERAWRTKPETELEDSALRVIVYKSAKYSVQAPLGIGATLAGGTPAQREALRAYGLPLGIAYQLRDDLLGVFGDAEVTGKPSGDDLREGKRTVLVARARTAMSGGARRIFDELLGDPGLEEDQIRTLQRTILGSGAVESVEALISEQVGGALDALTNAPITPVAKSQLTALAKSVAHRVF
ncbi:polyprenyl synthetase family protein [Glaciibacter superstes]|uniref:polyprenyl synthetase family protein n=1 Tax=Glaciibacter superstes TaxID=501023 RepID=UPI0003B6F09B|nr:polyprenyl synthetase family protein [Glaciibacter superstes]